MTAPGHLPKGTPIRVIDAGIRDYNDTGVVHNAMECSDGSYLYGCAMAPDGKFRSYRDAQIAIRPPDVGNPFARDPESNNSVGLFQQIPSTFPTAAEARDHLGLPPAAPAPAPRTTQVGDIVEITVPGPLYGKHGKVIARRNNSFEVEFSDGSYASYYPSSLKLVAGRLPSASPSTSDFTVGDVVQISIAGKYDNMLATVCDVGLSMVDVEFADNSRTAFFPQNLTVIPQLPSVPAPNPNDQPLQVGDRVFVTDEESDRAGQYAKVTVVGLDWCDVVFDRDGVKKCLRKSVLRMFQRSGPSLSPTTTSSIEYSLLNMLVNVIHSGVDEETRSDLRDYVEALGVAFEAVGWQRPATSVTYTPPPLNGA